MTSNARNRVQLYPPELGKINPKRPYAIDKLGDRKEFGGRLTELILCLEGPAVLLLDAPWGAGKTTFVNMWAAELRSKKVSVIQFDAFANDYQDDAFLALTGEVLKLAHELQGSDSERQNFMASAVKVAKIFGRVSIGVGIRMATAGLIPEGEFSGIVKDAAGEVAKGVDGMIETHLESIRENQGVIEEFQDVLVELIERMSKENRSEQSVDPSLVFIIDELDRCRPPFSLALLEKIKHLFNIPNIIFVLVTNLEQLETSVRFSYGGDIDAQTYLEKFYHLRVRFPDIVGDATAAELYVEYLFKEWVASAGPTKFRRSLKNEIIRIAQARTPALRSVERLVGYALLTCLSLKDENELEAPLVADLCALKVLDSKGLYAQACNGTIAYRDVARFFGYYADEESPPHVEVAAENIWRYLLTKPMKPKARELYGIKLMDIGGTDPGRVCSNHARYLDNFFFPTS